MGNSCIQDEGQLKKGIMNILQDTLAACRSLSIFLLVVDNAAMLLAGCSALIVSLAISKKYKKNLSPKNPLKIAGSGPYSKNGHTKKTDKIVRFFPNQEKINQTSFLINEFLVRNKPFLQQKYSQKPCPGREYPSTLSFCIHQQLPQNAF